MAGFIETCGDALESFRYFSSRPYSVIEEHLLTALLLNEVRPVAYGHLDPEAKTVWLGICVSDGSRGRGYGSGMMRHLIDWARTGGLEKLTLMVDDGNVAAVALYRKCGFEAVSGGSGRALTMTLSILPVEKHGD